MQESKSSPQRANKPPTAAHTGCLLIFLLKQVIFTLPLLVLDSVLQAIPYKLMLFKILGDVPVGSMAKTLCSHCGGLGSSLVRELDPTCRN